MVFMSDTIYNINNSWIVKNNEDLEKMGRFVVVDCLKLPYHIKSP